jgi:hypothetical protein
VPGNFSEDFMKSFMGAALAAACLFATACSGMSSDLLADAGSPGADAASAADAASGPDASTGEDAARPADAAGNDATAEDATPDVHTGPPDSKIQCGPQLACSAQNQICCWHQGSTTTPYQCVTSVGDCSGMNDVPITCSTPDNCASQGHPGYQCCATTGNLGSGQCYAYDVASVVACKSSCGVTDYEIGCSVKQQDCSDGISTCIVSKCTVPGDTMCY